MGEASESAATRMEFTTWSFNGLPEHFFPRQRLILLSCSPEGILNLHCVRYPITATVDGMILYRFLKAEYAIKTIQTKTLKVSNIDHTNDPWELSFIDRTLPSGAQLAKDIRDKIAEKHHLICFSETWQHPLMWAHYAERHKGICLGFRFGEKLIATDQCRPVEYINNPLILDLGPEPNEKSVRQVAWTKHSCWSYECEHRMFTGPLDKDCDNRAFVDIDDELVICEIIAGICCDLSLLDPLRADCVIPMFQAIPSPNAYRMDREII